MKKQLLSLLAFLTVTSLGSLAAQTIQPTPHSMTKGAGTLSISAGVDLRAAAEADPVAMELLRTLISENKKGVKFIMGERGDKALVKALGKTQPEIPALSGAYYLEVTPREIIIVGHDDRGTYYGVQTLKQLIKDGELPVVKITDYPDIQFRGSVEGFYGTPWSHRDRLAQLKFYGENKLNTYIYGPKDDPYHSSLSNHDGSNKPGGWRVPYPEAEAQNIRELAQTAKQYKVDFVWAIHPGKDIKWNEEDFNNLLHKFEKMYDLGVRSYAVFFDDISGEGTNPNKQAELLNRLNREFVQVKGDVTPLILCPTEYNKSWANPKPDGYLSILGDKLDKSVQIMWTGDRVCADITMETLNWINERIKRPTYIWWNFPVTDYVRHKLLQGPAYGLDTKATSRDMAGFVSNPMEHAEASKIALYGVADYTWNIAAYDYLATWERALIGLMPGAPAAFRTFAIHSSDLEQNGHGYRRDESWETKTFNPEKYTQAEYDAMYKEFADIAKAPAAILSSGADPYMLEEMKPWLVQFELLGKRGMQALELLKLQKAGDQNAVWKAFLEGVMTPEQIKAYNAHKPGTMVLNPFINTIRSVASQQIYAAMSGAPIKKVTPMSSFVRQETLPEMLDGNSKTYYYSWDAQKPGDWVGVDLGAVETVSNVYVEQGRKEGDRDLFQKAVLEYSTDKATWQPLTDILDNTYTIRYNSRPVEARYVRLRAEEGSSTKNWTAVRRFEVNPMQKSPIIMTNVPQVGAGNIVVEGVSVAIQPMLEIIKVEPQGYFGVEFPLITAIDAVEVDLNNKVASKSIEYSADGVTWTPKATSARYVRYVNNTNKPVEVKLQKFAVKTAAPTNGDIMAAFDQDILTGYVVAGTTTLQKPADAVAVSILTSLPVSMELVGRDATGQARSLGMITTGFAKFQLPADIVSLDLVGNATIYEIAFVQ